MALRRKTPTRRAAGAARAAYGQAVKKTKPGAGKRFGALEKVAALGGAKNPGAVAAAIGRRKYGPKKFTRMAVKGRKRALS